MILILVSSLILWLPGKRLVTCCFDTKFHPGHFAVLLLLMVAPIVESMCDVNQPWWSVILVGLALGTM